MSFGNPWALLLFLLFPVFIWFSRGQLLHLSNLRRWTAIVIRLLLLILLILALADTRWLRRSNTLSVVFLVDQSDSVTEAANRSALTFIQEALSDMPPDDSAGVVAFGENALVEESLTTNLQLSDFNSTPNSGYTNIADAIRLGTALFSADSAKRLVLVSDGNNNLGDARTAAQLAAANAIELSTVALTSQTGDEVRLNRIIVPSALAEGEAFDMEIEIHSTLATQTEVQVLADGQLLGVEQVNLESGENRFLFPLVAQGEGFSTFQVRLVPSQDTLNQNNRLDAYSIIERAQQVLVVTRDPAEVINLVPAIEAVGLQVQVVPPADMPTTPIALTQYDSLILVNLPAFSLSPSQLDLIQVYVRDLGHGLVTIGGPESYGAGGYYQTPLEESLPIDMTLKDQERLPGLSMFMVIDKSGSMDTGSLPSGGGPQKVELAKEAINRSIDLLTPFDRVGIITFDDAARWVVNPAPVVDINGIKSAVGTIRADGGTDILAGLQAAADEMAAEPSRLKHIVLLTDGGANPAGIPELVDELVAQDVSISVVAIGQDYAPFLEDVAEAGNGRFHLATDAATIPQIFAQEATLAQRAYIIEAPFTPLQTGVSPILEGIRAVPTLYGYIGTTPKLTAQTLLVSNQEDPVLAQWQYGLGRSVAWMSDAKGQWAQDWVRWDEFTRFWGQAIRWTIVEGAEGNLEAQVSLDSETGSMRLSVEALDQNGNYLNNLDLSGSLVSPDLSQSNLSLTQVAPGLYESSLRPDETGAYLLRILGTDADGQIASTATQGFVVSYSPEYAVESTPSTLMTDLAELGQGQTLALTDADQVFAHTLPPASGASPLWPLFLTIFVLLLPIDVGLRRIIVGREELRAFLQKLQRYLPQTERSATRPTTAPSSASSLLTIKRKTDRDDESTTDPIGRPTSTPPATTQSPVRASESPPTPQPETTTSAPPEQATTDFDSPATSDRMSRLLKAKREAQEKRQQK